MSVSEKKPTSRTVGNKTLGFWLNLLRAATDAVSHLNRWVSKNDKGAVFEGQISLPDVYVSADGKKQSVDKRVSIRLPLLQARDLLKKKIPILFSEAKRRVQEAYKTNRASSKAYILVSSQVVEELLSLVDVNWREAARSCLVAVSGADYLSSRSGFQKLFWFIYSTNPAARFVRRPGETGFTGAGLRREVFAGSPNISNGIAKLGSKLSRSSLDGSEVVSAQNISGLVSELSTSYKPKLNGSAGLQLGQAADAAAQIQKAQYDSLQKQLEAQIGKSPRKTSPSRKALGATQKLAQRLVQ